MDNSILKKWPPLIYLFLLAASPAGHAQPGYDGSKLTVEETAGPVKVRMSERWRTPANGMVVLMPSIASTGNDGNIKLRQQATLISVAANTAIEFLEGAVPGEPMQRVVQERGSAFYDIAPRGDNKLRVEAAYLVAVVKGTQFNVTVDADSTTIALFEGELQVEAPNLGDVVNIFAGQIARLHRDDLQISIINMENGELVARVAGSGGSGRLDDADSNGGGTSIDGSNIPALDSTAGLTAQVGSTSVTVDNTIALGVGTVETSLAGKVVFAGTSMAANLDTDVGFDSGETSLGAGSSVDLGDSGLGADVGVGADIGTGDVDLGVELGAIDVDASLDLGLASDVGESLTEDINALLEETEIAPDTTESGTADLLPDIGDLIGI